MHPAAYGMLHAGHPSSAVGVPLTGGLLMARTVGTAALCASHVGAALWTGEPCICVDGDRCLIAADPAGGIYAISRKQSAGARLGSCLVCWMYVR